MYFAARRLLLGILQLLGVSLLAFALLELAPGDYLDEMRIHPQIPQSTVDQWRQQYGLDRNVTARYLAWASSSLRGDFGWSMAYAMPVSHLVWSRARTTASLTLSALLISWSLAIPLAVWCAAHPRGWTDRLLGAAVHGLLALPDLLIALLVLTAAILLGTTIPISGKLLPAAIALACVSFPALFRHARSSLREALAMPFVNHLRACGVTEFRILFAHALPAAALPLIPLFGLSLAGLTSSSLVVEVVLSWPGLGPLLLESILARDAAVVLTAVLLSATLLVAGNLVADLLLYAADPRIRSEKQ